MIFTDLDGTLLDHHTYDWTPARPALDALAARGVPVVLCSSKTRVEMQALAQAMGLRAPLIAENGGGVWLPPSWALPMPDGAVAVDSGWVVALGVGVAQLRPALRELAARTRTRLHGFGDMDVHDVAARTGLTLDTAALAMQREFSEPFVAEDAPALETLDAAARDMGLRVTRGGRFFHLIGPTDKGDAVRIVRRWLGVDGHRRVLGFGDAPNDLALLQAVEIPVVVPRADATPHPDLVAALPHARIAPAPGPRGWNAVVLDWLDGDVRKAPAGRTTTGG